MELTLWQALDRYYRNCDYENMTIHNHKKHAMNERIIVECYMAADSDGFRALSPIQQEIVAKILGIKNDDL